jgi:protein-disulfide isomerase
MFGFRSVIPRLAALALVSLWSVSACKQGQSGKAAGTAPSASGSANVVAGVCGEYSAKVCNTAGSDSATCTAFKTSTELMPPEACKAGLQKVDFTLKRLATQRESCTELTKVLCGKFGKDSQSCKLVTEQTGKFPAERCKEMLGHVPEIVSELEAMEAQNKPLSTEQQSSLVAGPVPAFGPDDARVKVVEFSDFECPFCSRAATAVHKIREKYAKQVRFVFRQFPLPMHPNARPAAIASLEAEAQGKFWAFHDKLFEKQGELTREGLERRAQEVGLDLARFKRALDENTHAAQVDHDVKLGEGVRVNGTPTMFVNGKRVDNPTDADAISSMIEAELKAAPPG